MSIVVNEIFGPTFQGEGPSLGRRCAFLRVSACNLACSWCDTPYTWDWTGQNGTKYSPKTESHKMEVSDIIHKLLPMGVDTLVISGGEPLLQQERLVELAEALFDWDIQIETAGTIAPSFDLQQYVSLFNVSPKLAHSRNPLEKRYQPKALEALQKTEKVAWKFVAQRPSDLEEVDQLVQKHGLNPVYIMPEGRDPATISEHIKDLADAVLLRGWNMTTRLHVQIWGDKRGV